MLRRHIGLGAEIAVRIVGAEPRSAGMDAGALVDHCLSCIAVGDKIGLLLCQRGYETCAGTQMKGERSAEGECQFAFHVILQWRCDRSS
ncbi:hypothetical protein D9M69_673420 [compost metagenome]